MNRRGIIGLSVVAIVVAVLGVAAWSIAHRMDVPQAMPALTNGLFHTLTSAADWGTGTLGGTKVASAQAGTPGGTPTALVLDPASGLGTGQDSSGLYNGGSYFFGTFVSPVYASPVPVNEAVASWAADTPEGTWIEVDARALVGGTWTKYYIMGIWASGTATIRRHNAGSQADSRASVDTDTLRLTAAASAIQLKALLFTTDQAVTPRLRRLSVVATTNTLGPGGSGGSATGGTGGTAATTPYRAAWGRDLAVPERRQAGFPGGSGWCSPTSLSMLMAYWSDKTGNAAWNQTVPDTAAGVKDYGYGGTGNWAFNTAFAASLGFDSYVTRYESLAGVERWIAAGVPVAINIEFGKGGLTGAPVQSTDGHVIVIRGFDRNGNPIVNDPAAHASLGEKVRIVYNRAQLEKAWQGRPQGTVYILFPPGYPTP